MKKVRKAVIPVAGMGTRFLPATKAQPKEMLTLVDKPLIQYNVEEAVASGIEEIIFITSSTKRAIEDHFDRNFELEYRLGQKNKKKELAEIKKISKMAKFIYVRQATPLGLGHAIYMAKELINDEPFAVLLGDDIIDAEVPAIKQMIDVYDRYEDMVLGLTKVPKKETSKYGIADPLKIDKSTVEVKRLVEKPSVSKAPSNLANVGRYILTPEIFKILSKGKKGAGNEIQLADAVDEHAKKRAVYGCILDGTYYDCGKKLGFVEATINYALKRKEFSSQLRKYLKNI